MNELEIQMDDGLNVKKTEIIQEQIEQSLTCLKENHLGMAREYLVNAIQRLNNLEVGN